MADFTVYDGKRIRNTRRRTGPACLVIVAALLLGAGDARAQAIPESVQPGQLKERYLERPLPPPTEAPVVPEAEAPLPPAEAEEIRFVLSGVVVEGSTVYDEAEFVPFYEKYLAREVSLADVYKIAAAITKKYRDDGYVLTRTVVPPQEIELGIVRIRVIEGGIDNVIIRGEVHGDRDLLEAYGRKITEDRPLQLAVLERYVLLIDDLPGVVARPSVEPVEDRPGSYDLVIFLEHARLEGFARADNRGSRFVGPLQAWVGAVANSALGLYERTQFRFITTSDPDELKYFELNHTENVGSEGTKVTFTGSESISEPGFTLAPSDVRSEGTRLDLAAIHPLIRSGGTNLFLTGRLTYWKSQLEVGDRNSADDRLRVVAAGVDLSFPDGLRGRNDVAVEASQGLDILDATDAGSPNLSRAGGEADFTKVTLSASRYQPLAPDWAVFTAVKAQKSANKLLVSEQIGLGGEDFGRAYDPSEITGDDGAALRVELQHDRFPGIRAIDRYQLYLYYGIGAVWTRGSGAGRDSLASLGGGVRVVLFGRYSGYLELAAPLTRPVATQEPDGNDVRAFFALAASF